MSWYVSVIDGRKSVLALGPFNRHGDALARVDEVRDYVVANERDGRGWFYGFGTAQHRTGRPSGALNDRLGLSA